MAEDRIAFTCSCGAPGEAPDIAMHPWAQLVGYTSHAALRWHATRADAMVDEPPIDILDAPPRPGQTCWLRLNMPFAGASGDTFWGLYESPMAFFNGIDGMPEDVATLHVAACRLVRWERHGTVVIGEVVVGEVLSLADLRRRPAFGTADDEQLMVDIDMPTRHSYRSGDYRILSAGLEGDTGSWAVLADGAKGPEILLLGVWDDHYDTVWAGRGELSPTQAARLIKLYGD